MNHSFFILFSLVTLLGSTQAIQLPTNCGQQQTPLSAGQHRIVGGQLAKTGQWPWQVYLNKSITYEGEVITSDCGGAIVSKDYILTAAHCVYDSVTNDFGIKFAMEVVAGAVDVAVGKTNSGEVRRKVAKVFLHEHFSYERKQNDIALLKLDRSLDFAAAEKHIAPVCLAKEEFFEGCYATGFGYTDAAMTGIDYKLRGLAEARVADAKCDEHFLFYNSTVNVCIGGQLNHGTCKGDSGSPFVCHHGSTNRWFQMGLVSYGLPCALADTPDVLTRVAHYYDWIQAHSG